MLRNKLIAYTLSAITTMSCSQPEEKDNSGVKTAEIESPEAILRHGE